MGVCYFYLSHLDQVKNREKSCHRSLQHTIGWAGLVRTEWVVQRALYFVDSNAAVSGVRHLLLPPAFVVGVPTKAVGCFSEELFVFVYPLFNLSESVAHAQENGVPLSSSAISVVMVAP